MFCKQHPLPPLNTYIVGICYVKCIQAVDNNKAQPVWFGVKFSVMSMFLGLYIAGDCTVVRWSALVTSPVSGLIVVADSCIFNK